MLSYSIILRIMTILIIIITIIHIKIMSSLFNTNNFKILVTGSPNTIKTNEYQNWKLRLKAEQSVK